MRSFTKGIYRNDVKLLWLLALPGILHFVVFKYIPMFGNVIAFQNYNIFQGVFESPWVGWFHFERMFLYPEFYEILKNTLVISFYSIVFGFPAPLVLALLLNELRQSWIKRPVQTLLYLPHFLSWVIVGGIFTQLLNPTGVVNKLLASYGIERIDFLTNPDTFVGMIVSLGIWKEVGWGMIIYLAALAGINPNLYEAAMVDGANRWRRMWHITLPSLLPSIVVLFLLRIGNLLDANVEQMLVFMNPLVRDVGEVIDTYVYSVGLLSAQFSYTTAIGLFKSVIGIALVVGLNQLSRKTTGESIY
ncbi:ABC transporter permease [Paenibacillus sp.]|uniref:ABC transporter permease n=1 Tax=Paenibacillus sp. TaxID=58172 RepID=UPI002D3D87AC|nr:ABC transporter permease subunit [Paenibacillus sp.]HZG57947.1 ABC transporter permease subunit [Paenibacillus sp.]